MATECSQNDRSKTQYYVVILDRLQGHSRVLERTPELQIRGPLTIVVVYLDDILIFTETEQEHKRAVWRVLEVLAEHKLFFHPEKCEFHQKQIEYLRLVISENKVKMDPVKVAGVCD